MDPMDLLRDATVEIADPTYAVCRTSDGHPDAFATVRDEDGTTVVVTEATLDDIDAEAVERGWRRLTFRMDLPFELVGFLAVVSTALAEADVSVFALSAYSTDHVLVKTADIDAARTQLEQLGCTVEGD